MLYLFNTIKRRQNNSPLSAKMLLEHLQIVILLLYRWTVNRQSYPSTVTLSQLKSQGLCDPTFLINKMGILIFHMCDHLNDCNKIEFLYLFNIFQIHGTYANVTLKLLLKLYCKEL